MFTRSTLLIVTSWLLAACNVDPLPEQATSSLEGELSTSDADAAHRRIHVDFTAALGGDGASWATALTSVQESVDLAVSRGGGEIWIAGGTYLSTSTSAKDPVLRIEGSDTRRIEIYGGFGGFEDKRDQRDPAKFATVLDGQGLSYHVVRGYGDYVLDGLTITRGNAQGAGSDGEGGGLYASDGTPEIRGCTFVDNIARVRGGGMHIDDHSVVIVGSRFEQNMAIDVMAEPTYENGATALGAAPIAYGGALSASGSATSTIVVRDSTFTGNYTSHFGGGVWIGARGARPSSTDGPTDGPSVELERVTFFDQKTDWAYLGTGGAIHLASGTLVATEIDCEGYASSGGCLAIAAGASATIFSSRISALADEDAGAIHNAGSLTIHDTTIIGSSSYGLSETITITRGATARLYDSLFDDNRGYASAVFSNSGTLEMVNCTVRETETPLKPTPALHLGEGAVTTIVNSTFWPMSAPELETDHCP